MLFCVSVIGISWVGIRHGVKIEILTCDRGEIIFWLVDLRDVAARRCGVVNCG